MTNTKNTKRALLTSAMALFLCFAMLIGTTYAWFTDSVTSTNNIIKSGNLDVELQWSTDFENWEVFDADTNVFSDGLWEPGHMEVVYLKISNVGSLALRYRLNINVAGETGSTNVLGEAFKLSEHIGYGVVENVTGKYADRDAAIAAVGAEEFMYLEVPYVPDRQDLYPTTNLPKDSASETIVALVVYMDGEVGNEANAAKDAPVPTINLGINLFASQLMYEEDSYGKDYDADADIVIQKGEMANINANTNQTINGVIENSGIVNITDCEIVNDGTGFVNYGDANLKNVIATITEGSRYFTLGKTDSETTFDKVYITTKGGGIELSDGAEGIFKSGSVTTNSTATSGRHVFYVYDGAKLTIEGGDFKFNPDNLTRKGFYVCATNGSTVVINGGNFDKPSTRSSTKPSTNYKAGFYADDTSKIIVTGGTFGFDPSNWLADGYAAVQYNDKFYVVPGTIDAISTVVSSSSELAAAITNAGVVYIAADIDMNNEWASVVPANNLILVGNGHTITNLNKPLLAGKGGPVVTVMGLTIADSNVGIAAVENGLGTGAFMAFADYSGNVIFEDCHLLNSSVTGNERAAAFIAYSQAALTIKNCSVENCTIEAVGSTAALVGHANGKNIIENSIVKNTKVTATEDRTGKAAVAGSLIGTVANNTVLNNVTAAGNSVSNTGATPVSAEFGRVLSGKILTVDGVQYAFDAAALKTALAAGGDVALGADIKATDVVTLAEISNVTATLDLNGHKIDAALNGANGWSQIFRVSNGANFTVKGEGEVHATAYATLSYGSVIFNNVGGNLNIDGGKYTMTYGSYGEGYLLPAIVDTNSNTMKATTTINGGEFYHTRNMFRNFAQPQRGDNNATLIINGGTFVGEADDFGSIWNQKTSGSGVEGDGIVTINGGNFQYMDVCNDFATGVTIADGLNIAVQGA